MPFCLNLLHLKYFSTLFCINIAFPPRNGVKAKFEVISELSLEATKQTIFNHCRRVSQKPYLKHSIMTFFCLNVVFAALPPFLKQPSS